jgi:hypothetical protein
MKLRNQRKSVEATRSGRVITECNSFQAIEALEQASKASVNCHSSDRGVFGTVAN